MNPASIVLMVVVLLLLVLYPILMMRRNKREQEKQKQMVESLRVGEYVLTYSGVFGKITEIIEKEVGKFLVIETGESNKNYVTVSENAIYSIVNNNPKVYDEHGEVKKVEEEKVADAEETKEVIIDGKPVKKSSKKETF